MGTAIGDLLEKDTISLDYLKGRIVGIDSYNILYQFLSSIRGYDGSPLMDSKGEVTSHLTGLFYRTINLIEKEVKPVFVFDGKPPELKSKTLMKRQETRTEAETKQKEAQKKGEIEEARKYGQRALRLSKGMVEEAKKLVEFMGLPVLQAESDGEAQIAAMVDKGDLFGCVSQDYDALLFGSPLVFRNVTISGKRKLPGKNIYVDIEPQKIELKKSLNALGIDRRKLIWIGILVGTDFNEKFPGVGPKTALKLVKGNDSFEGIIKETGFEPEFDYKEIEEIFMNPPLIEDYNIVFNLPDREKVKEFLCEKHDFSEERVENALKRLEKKIEEKGRQSALDKWF